MSYMYMSYMAYMYMSYMYVYMFIMYMYMHMCMHMYMHLYIHSIQYGNDKGKIFVRLWLASHLTHTNEFSGHLLCTW